MSFIKKIIIWVLTVEARLILAKYKPTIIAVTGSVGKTSTKDAIFTVLKNSGGFVRKAEKSMNSEFGLPLTIIGIPTAWRSVRGWMSNIWTGLKLILKKSPYPNTLVLEVGADHPGDIRNVAHWLRPHIAIITRISMTPVHVEFFSSPEEVFEEKASLAEAVRPKGTVILFADESKILTLRDRLKDKDVTIVTFGTSAEAKALGSEYATVYENNAPVGFTFKINLESIESITMRGIIGTTYMYPLLAAAAVGKVRGMSAAQIARALSAFEPPRGRMNIIPGIKNSTIIDDTYNSSPDATSAALETIKSLQTSGRKIAVLADMMELGKYSSEEHRRIGAQAVTSVKELITVGLRSRSGTADEALKKGMYVGAVHSFSTAAEAVPRLTALIRSGDIILIKGSQSMRMEHIVKALMREPEKAGELLVRQEKEWLDKA
jgi:UDP-N-acetylmuramoyl-tripeptide--D-alanyl-D-alanine ligase